MRLARGRRGSRPGDVCEGARAHASVAGGRRALLPDAGASQHVLDESPDGGPPAGGGGGIRGRRDGRSQADRPAGAALEVQELYATIAGLSEDFRLAIVAVDVLGLSYREASRALGVREATITTRLFRARRQTAERLRGPAAANRDPEDARAAGRRSSARPRKRDRAHAGEAAKSRPRGGPLRGRDGMNGRTRRHERPLVPTMQGPASSSIRAQRTTDGRRRRPQGDRALARWIDPQRDERSLHRSAGDGSRGTRRAAEPGRRTGPQTDPAPGGGDPDGYRRDRTRARAREPALTLRPRRSRVAVGRGWSEGLRDLLRGRVSSGLLREDAVETEQRDRLLRARSERRDPDGRRRRSRRSVRGRSIAAG